LEQLPHHAFVFKTEVQSSYASMDHQRLLDRLALSMADRHVLNLIGQYLHCCAEGGGLFWEHRWGIAVGSPLSPILGTFFLTEVDGALERRGLFFVWFMDDILVLAPTRWKLRHAVKVVNQAFASLAVAKHPDKTCL
jgi:RNA-directed DNA polymerase